MTNCAIKDDERKFYYKTVLSFSTRSLRSNFHIRNCLGWASSRGVFEGCVDSASNMCTLKTLDAE